MKGLKEKLKVAGLSVFAAVILTGSKLIIGLLTNSLGILSEALHSMFPFSSQVVWSLP